MPKDIQKERMKIQIMEMFNVTKKKDIRRIYEALEALNNNEEDWESGKKYEYNFL
jgi:hypothetical protein